VLLPLEHAGLRSRSVGCHIVWKELLTHLEHRTKRMVDTLIVWTIGVDSATGIVSDIDG
jgi:hypothetical protein